MQVEGEASKNHSRDSEELNNLVPFLKNEVCNPGNLMELYLELTNPENARLFQRARDSSKKKFNLHDLDVTVLFENAPVGRDAINKNLKTLCQILGKEEMTNHCIRTTGINILKRSGYDDRDIVATSGIYFS